MERRVAGIIRWLERCVKAYKNGAVESALMDAECAKADMDTLRGDLWKKLEGRSVRARRASFFKASEAFLWALGIVLITAAPLTLQQDGAVRENRVDENFTLEWVTPDEIELLGNLRKRPDETVAFLESPMNSVNTAPEEPIAEPQIVPVPVPVPVRAAEPVRRRSPEPPSLTSAQRKPETSLSYDSILSLIETGERAMKNEPPAIIVENVR